MVTKVADPVARQRGLHRRRCRADQWSASGTPAGPFASGRDLAEVAMILGDDTELRREDKTRFTDRSTTEHPRENLSSKLCPTDRKRPTKSLPCQQLPRSSIPFRKDAETGGICARTNIFPVVPPDLTCLNPVLHHFNAGYSRRRRYSLWKSPVGPSITISGRRAG